jgi:hypothetical protein
MDAARKLVSDAGFSPQNPLRTTFMVPTGGTGQMLSMPVNEFVQESWAEIASLTVPENVAATAIGIATPREWFRRDADRVRPETGRLRRGARAAVGRLNATCYDGTGRDRMSWTV